VEEKRPGLAVGDVGKQSDSLLLGGRVRGILAAVAKPIVIAVARQLHKRELVFREIQRAGMDSHCID
jgi:hypothetical protein